MIIIYRGADREWDGNHENSLSELIDHRSPLGIDSRGDNIVDALEIDEILWIAIDQ